jgi:nicotinate-nucleotide adenylyltransferase
MNIALLGGAFNPPHLGHRLIAQQVLDFTDIEEVWFVPNFQGHHLRDDVVSTEHRLAMLKQLETPRIRVSTIEIDNQLDGKTIHLLPHLPEGHKYTFIIGSDWLSFFHKWEQYEELLEQMSFLVIPRYGFANKPLYKNMTVLDHPLLMTSDISATKIRERVHQGLSIELFVPESVAKYIEQHRLYL